MLQSKMASLTHFLCLLLALNLPENSLQTQPSQCVVATKYGFENNSTVIKCYRVGADGRPLDALVRDLTYNRSGVNLNFDDIAGTIRDIDVYAVKSNATVKISPKGLAKLVNLEFISIAHDIYEDAKGNYQTDLVINKNEFQHVLRLKELYIVDFNLVPDTLHAVGELKNRLEALTMIGVTPVDEVISLAKKFTNLCKLALARLDNIGTQPQEAWQGSAKKLILLRLININLQTITTAMFRGMSNLTHLITHGINITSIEQGAFDDLVNLEYFLLSTNHRMMTMLPNGLFNKTKKLQKVILSETGIENLSRANFTHCPNFKSLKVDEDDY